MSCPIEILDSTDHHDRPLSRDSLPYRADIALDGDAAEPSTVQIPHGHGLMHGLMPTVNVPQRTQVSGSTRRSLQVHLFGLIARPVLHPSASPRAGRQDDPGA